METVDKSAADKSQTQSPPSSPTKRKSIMQKMLAGQAMKNALGRKLTLKLGEIKADQEAQKKDEI